MTHLSTECTGISVPQCYHSVKHFWLAVSIFFLGEPSRETIQDHGVVHSSVGLVGTCAFSATLARQYFLALGVGGDHVASSGQACALSEGNYVCFLDL